MKKHFLKLSMLLTFLSVMQSDLKAQTDTSKMDLTKISLEDLLDVKITTASRTEQKAGQAAASVIVITEEQIRIRGYTSLLEVLQDLPDFKVDDKVLANNRNVVTVRGVQGQEKFVIMLDGVRISSPTNETVPIMENYPVNLAKQIEVIYGPASALYGADAISGVINIISKSAEWTKEKTEASLITGNYGLYNGSLFTSRKFKKDITLTLSGQYFYDQGPDMSKLNSDDPLWNISSHNSGTFNTIYGPMTPKAPVSSGFAAPLSAYNIYAGLKMNDFTFTFFKNYSQNSSSLEYNPSNAVYNKDAFLGRGVTVINAAYTKVLGEITSSSSLTGSEYQVNPQSNYRNVYSLMEPGYKYGFGSMIAAEERIAWNISSKVNLVGGAIYQSYISAPLSADLQSPVAKGDLEGTLVNTQSYYRPEGIEAKFYLSKYYNAGGYLQFQYTPTQKVSITLGSRYDYNSRYGYSFNPRLGTVWNPTSTLTIKAMAASAFLAPTPTDAYSYYGSFYTQDSGKTYHSNFMHLPNPGLKPMTTKNIELSVRKLIGKNFAVTLTAYYTEFDNLIRVGPDQGNTNLYGGKFQGYNVDYIEVYINSNRQQSVGGTLKLDQTIHLKKGKITSYAAISYIDGTEDEVLTDSTGKETKVKGQLDIVSNWMLKAGTDITIGKFFLSPRLIFIGRQRLDAFVDPSNPFEKQTLDGYALLNISVGYQIRKLTLFIKVTNALNQHYRDTGPNIDLNDKNTPLLYGSVQDPIRINGGLKIIF